MLTQKNQKNIVSEKESCVVFGLDHKKFALSLSHVVNVLRMVEISPLPRLHPFVLGVINCHGKILPVFNLRKYMNCPEREIDLSDSLIIVRGNEKYFAIWADSVDEVVEIPKDQIISFEKVSPEINGMKGFINRNYEIVLIQDAVIDFEKVMLVNNDENFTEFSKRKYGT